MAKKFTSALAKSLFIEGLKDFCPFPTLGNQGEIDRWCEWLNFPKGLSLSEFSTRAMRVWQDPKQWVRQSKSRMKTGLAADNYIVIEEDGAYGFVGEDRYESGSQEVLKRYHGNEDNCWIRVFTPSNIFADNFRVEFMTTPTDDELVGWLLAGD
jgi:hypothetical protein